MDDDLEAAFREVEAAWDDDAAHRRFLALADATDRLAQAGQRYRAVRDADDARRESAQRWLDDVVARAFVRIAAQRTPPEARGKRSRVEWALMGVSVVLLGAALYQLLRMLP